MIKVKVGDKFVQYTSTRTYHYTILKVTQNGIQLRNEWDKVISYCYHEKMEKYILDGILQKPITITQVRKRRIDDTQTAIQTSTRD
jgi:hypothetical protein